MNHGLLQTLVDGLPLSRCLVIAELGVNHNGSLQEAIALLDAAKASGADCAKIQLYNAEDLCSQLYRSAEIGMLNELRLSDNEHRELARYAQKIDLPLLATPFDSASLQTLLDLKLPVIKIGSGEITHTPFLAEVASTGKPVILSTGGCQQGDIERAVGTLETEGCVGLNLLHCVSAYPPPDEQLNLRMINTLKRSFPDLNIGYSDHSVGIDAAVAAVASGAIIVEKHLTRDCAAIGPDHAASADPSCFLRMVGAIRQTEAMLGTGQKRLQPCEGTIGRSIVAARDLPAGHPLTREDLAFKRPGDGLRPHRWHEIIGQVLSQPREADQQITLTDLVSEPNHAAISAQ